MLVKKQTHLPFPLPLTQLKLYFDSRLRNAFLMCLDCMSTLAWATQAVGSRECRMGRVRGHFAHCGQRTRKNRTPSSQLPSFLVLFWHKWQNSEWSGVCHPIDQSKLQTNGQIKEQTMEQTNDQIHEQASKQKIRCVNEWTNLQSQATHLPHVSWPRSHLLPTLTSPSVSHFALPLF